MGNALSRWRFEVGRQPFGDDQILTQEPVRKPGRDLAGLVVFLEDLFHLGRVDAAETFVASVRNRSPLAL